MLRWKPQKSGNLTWPTVFFSKHFQITWIYSPNLHGPTVFSQEIWTGRSLQWEGSEYILLTKSVRQTNKCTQQHSIIVQLFSQRKLRTDSFFLCKESIVTLLNDIEIRQILQNICKITILYYAIVAVFLTNEESVVNLLLSLTSLREK